MKNKFGIFGAFLFLFHFTLANASEEVLRWGADTTSGVPFVFVDPEHPDQMRGFEKEILDEVARILGKKLVVVQNDWESLVPSLTRGDFDVAANGIEVTPEREEQVNFSTPYYATHEQIVVKSTNENILNSKDLDGKRVGTLKASLAHYILEKQTKAHIVFYEEEDAGFSDVANGRIDAFFIDYPVALYYAKPNAKLKLVGPEIGKMTYAIAISKKNSALLVQVNAALQKMFESGALEKILAKWNLLSDFTEKELGINKLKQLRNSNSELNKVAAEKNRTLTFAARMARYQTLMPLLIKGAVTTLQISILSMIVAVIFGLTLAIMRLYGNALVSFSAQSIIEILRGTPLLIQLYLIFFGLPYIGIEFSPFWAAIFGLGINYGAYEAENYRTGMEAIPKSQTEAALALALSPVQRFVYVLLPQASKIILPPMTNDFISLIKDSSLVSVITMVELTTIYSQLSSTYFDHLGLGILVALIYFILGYPFVRLARRLELNLKKKI